MNCYSTAYTNEARNHATALYNLGSDNGVTSRATALAIYTTLSVCS